MYTHINRLSSTIVLYDKIKVNHKRINLCLLFLRLTFLMLRIALASSDAGAGSSGDLGLFANDMLLLAAIPTFCLIVTFICILLMTSYLSRIVKRIETISDNIVKKYQYDIERERQPSLTGSIDRNLKG